MGMAMFKRKFARTIPDNLRAPHMKMWGFEAKRARKFTRTSPRTLPWNFITMPFSSLIQYATAGLAHPGEQASSLPATYMIGKSKRDSELGKKGRTEVRRGHLFFKLHGA